MGGFEILAERGFVERHTEDVPALLDSATPVTFYVGFDPTADSLHVGHLLPVMAMAHLQRAGHKPIAIVGGGTAMVGDPAGRDESRPIMSLEDLERNKRGLRRQLSLLLDLSDGQGMLVDNADWLCAWNYLEFLRDVGVHFPMMPMLNRASVQERLKKGMSFLEFNYQLLQAYDFLELFRRHGCTLQMGGDDQWGNILAGRDLIRRVGGGAEAHGLTFGLLKRSDGQKMGKTASGAIWLDPDRLSPYHYFQYWVNVPDADVGKLLRLFTFLPLDRIEELEALSGADVREAKQILALEATAIIHGATEAQKALEGARAAFAGGGAVAAIPRHHVKVGDRLFYVLHAAGLCRGTNDGKNLIAQGSVRLGDRVVTDSRYSLAESDFVDGEVELWKGKKDTVRLFL